MRRLPKWLALIALMTGFLAAAPVAAGDNEIEFLRSYVGDQKIWQCPTRQNGWADPWNNNQRISYCYNYYPLDGRSITETSSCYCGPSKLLVMWDSDNAYNDCNPWDSCGIQSRDIPYYRNKTGQNCWHNGQGNNLYSDGHVGNGHFGQFTWDQIVGPRQTNHNGVSCMVAW